MKNSKWRVVLGLILLYVAVLMNWSWVWGVLFLIWVLPDLLTGVTHFIETVEKKKNPMLYWTIIISWVWMSLFMVAIDVAPNALQAIFPAAITTQSIGTYEDAAQAPSSVQTINKTNVTSTGTYQDQAIQPKKSTSNTANSISQVMEKVENVASSSMKKDSLNYKTYSQKETQYFVGISSAMNFSDPDLEKNTEALWNYFVENDISQVIPNIVDERVYFIYSDNDAAGNYKATIAYRTKDIKDVYEGLEGISVAATNFAVFEQTSSDSSDFLSKTWEKIYNSDLGTKNGTSLEVYTFDKNYNITKTEIRVPLN